MSDKSDLCTACGSYIPEGWKIVLALHEHCVNDGPLPGLDAIKFTIQAHHEAGKEEDLDLLAEKIYSLFSRQ